MYARLLARREGRELDWTLQRDDVVSPLIATNDPAPLTAAEYGQASTSDQRLPALRERSTRALGLDDPGATRAPRSTLVQFRARRCDESYAWIHDAPSAKPSPRQC